MTKDTNKTATTNEAGPFAHKRTTAVRPLNMTRRDLAGLIRQLPGEFLDLAVVYVEDVYETVCGDGYYSYPERAYFSLAAAERCAGWINYVSSSAYRAEVKIVRVDLDATGACRVSRPRGAELLNWEQASLMELINGNSYDWVTHVDGYMGEGCAEPDFCDVPPTVDALIKAAPVLRLTVTSSSGTVRQVELTPDMNLPDVLDPLVEDGFADSLRAELEKVPAESAVCYLASRLLVKLEVHAGVYSQAAERGLAMIEARTLPLRSRIDVAIACCYAGRPEDGYHVLKGLPRLGLEWQLACCASQTGRFAEALACLRVARFTQRPDMLTRMATDWDLAPLWKHLLTKAPTFAEYAIIAHPDFTACIRSPEAPCPPPAILDHLDHAGIPSDFRPAIKECVAWLCYEPKSAGDPGYDPILAKELTDFLTRDSLERRTSAWLACQAAMIPVTALAEAEAAASDGDMRVARRKLTFLAAAFPNVFEDLPSFCRHARLRALATEFSAVLKVSPTFYAEFETAREKRDAARMIELLTPIPAVLLPLGTIQFSHGHAATSSRDIEAAVQAYRAAARCWPDDGAPFHNGAQLLAQGGRWDDAAEFLAQAPASFRESSICRSLVESIAAHKAWPRV